MPPFQQSLSRLRVLLLTQRSLRLLIRALWTGAAGYLIAWGISRVYGVLPESTSWGLLGLLFAAPSLLAIARPLRMSQLTWGLDRRMELQEQISAAWQISKDTETNPIGALLIEDARALLPGSRSRILRRGWYLGKDVEALAIIVVLLIAIFWSGQFNTVFTLPESPSQTLPGLAESPGSSDVFPSGIPGLTGQPPGDQAEGIPVGAGELAPEEIGALDNILTGLGEALSEYPETAPAGEALQNGDLEGAAASIERIAENVDLLPQEARQNTQQALQQAAQQAQDAGQDSLAEDLQRAASALENLDPDNPLTADALDDLADELRNLAEQFAAMGLPGEGDSATPPGSGPQVGSSAGASGAGSGSGTTGEPEPITRLEGEGQDFTLQGGDDPSGLLTPGNPAGEPALPAGGTPVTVGPVSAPGDAGPVDSILTPYHFPWRWRDVVSEYFSPPP